MVRALCICRVAARVYIFYYALLYEAKTLYHVSVQETVTLARIWIAFLSDAYDRCAYEDKCQFAHGRHELRKVPTHPPTSLRPAEASLVEEEESHTSGPLSGPLSRVHIVDSTDRALMVVDKATGVRHTYYRPSIGTVEGAGDDGSKRAMVVHSHIRGHGASPPPGLTTMGAEGGLNPQASPWHASTQAWTPQPAASTTSTFWSPRVVPDEAYLSPPSSTSSCDTRCAMSEPLVLEADEEAVGQRLLPSWLLADSPRPITSSGITTDPGY
jgi:hypothetical protein